MRGRIASVLVTCVLVVATLVGCAGAQGMASAAAQTAVRSAAGGEAAAGADAAAPTTSGATAAAGSILASGAAGADTEAALIQVVGTAALAEDGKDREVVEAYAWDESEVVQITLDGQAISAEGWGVTVSGSKAVITAGGAYRLSGSLDDGQIIVDAQDGGTVVLILNGVEMHSSTSAPIYVMDSEATVIVLADGSENSVSDGDSYVFEYEADEPSAAIFSKDPLTIAGNGSLTVEATFNDGIASKDGLIITGGAIAITSVDDGIRGKDYLIVRGGQITIDAQGDGLKSDNEEDATLGYVLIEDGVLDITSGGDAIQAQTAVRILDGDFTLLTGGGSNGRIAESASAKGIKGAVSVTIAGGTLRIDSADDAIHSNGSIVIDGGSYVLASGDDGMHADATLDINAGDINITTSYEGLESAVITISDGTIHIVSSDDGINVVGGNDASGFNRGPGFGGGGGPGQDSFASLGNNYLYIHGGYVAVNAGGDGLDINGSVQMTDGLVLVHGPTENMNGPLDYLGSFSITGGFLIAVGSAGMAQAPDESSTQYSVLLNLNSALRAGTLVRVQTSEGDEILTFEPAKPYQSIAFSTPALANGATYDVYFGGSSSGTESDGLYQGGEYTDGTLAGSFTTSGMVTRLGSSRRR